MTTTKPDESKVPTCPHFDPMAPSYQESPYPLFAELRRDAPVSYSPQYDFWVVTRYEDVSAVLKQPEIFSSVGSLQSNAALPPAVTAVLATGLGAATIIVESDPPDHTRMRSVFNKAFTPQRIARLEPQIRALTDALIDAFIADRKADLTTQFSSQLPGLVICDLIGVPRADFPQIKRWSDDWMVLLSGNAPEERLVACAKSFVACQRYFLEQLLLRQKEPREDLLSVMLPADLGGTAAMTAAEAAYNALDVVVAGFETTTHTLDNGLALLFAHPEQLEALRQDPTRIPDAIEEILRIDTPVTGLFRITKSATELGGATLPAGARLFLLFSSANHDAAQFEDAARFDIKRENARDHLSFSRGIHFCIGSNLARLELRIALERLFARLPNLRPAADVAPQRMTHFWLRGYDSLPITWDAG